MYEGIFFCGKWQAATHKSNIFSKGAIFNPFKIKLRRIHPYVKFKEFEKTKFLQNKDLQSP